MGRQDRKNKQSSFFDRVFDSYTFKIILLVFVILCVAGNVYGWVRRNLWDSVIPYTVETTIVANSQLLDENNSNTDMLDYPLTLSQEIIVNSSDLDILYDRIEEHIDTYLSFSVTMMAIVITLIGVVIPIFNYSFLQKDVVTNIRNENESYIIELNGETDSFIKDLQNKKKAYEESFSKMDDLSKRVQQAESDLKEIEIGIKLEMSQLGIKNLVTEGIQSGKPNINTAEIKSCEGTSGKSKTNKKTDKKTKTSKKIGKRPNKKTDNELKESDHDNKNQ